MGTTLLVGAVVGVVIVVAGAVLWRLALNAWSYIAHESSVAGAYLVYDDQSCATKVGEARVRQYGTRVYVEVKRNISRDGLWLDKPTKFKCNGYFRSGVLTALFFDTDSSYRPGSVCLYYVAHESSLDGNALYYRPDGGVMTFTLKFVRKVKRHVDL